MYPIRVIAVRMVLHRASLKPEQGLWDAGWHAVAGIDEAGRGAWAGPVVAAAVIFPPDAASLSALVGRVDDSKRLTPGVRERLLDEIEACAQAVGIGFASREEIDALGIAAATRSAMMRAVACLAVPPDFLLIDYLTLTDLPQEQLGLVHGDALSLSIAAASIVAKVTRDRWMVEQEPVYPGYGFARHKGYGTPEHRAALQRLGPSGLHRRSFRPLSLIAAAERATGDS